MSSAFHLEERDDGIGLLTLDLPDKKVNTLGQAVLAELAGAGRPARRGGPTSAGCSSAAASPASSSPGPT